MPQETKQKLEPHAGDTDAGAPLQGVSVDDRDPLRLWAAVEAAFHYRGDVQLGVRDRAQPIEGYLFDRLERHPLSHSTLRIMVRDSEETVSLQLCDLTMITFSGKDTAAGRSFDNWMKRYVERKLAGRAASIESDPLEES